MTKVDNTVLTWRTSSLPLASSIQGPPNVEHSCSNVRQCSFFLTLKCSMFECSPISKCSKVRMFANIRMFGCSMFECLLTFGCSKVRMFGNIRIFFNFFLKTMFACSNVRRTWTNIRTLNTNVHCSVAPAHHLICQYECGTPIYNFWNVET